MRIIPKKRTNNSTPDNEEVPKYVQRCVDNEVFLARQQGLLEQGRLSVKKRGMLAAALHIRKTLAKEEEECQDPPAQT